MDTFSPTASYDCHMSGNIPFGLRVIYTLYHHALKVLLDSSIRAEMHIIPLPKIVLDVDSSINLQDLLSKQKATNALDLTYFTQNL